MLLGLSLSICSPQRPASGGGTPAPSLASADYTIVDAAGGDKVTLTGTNLSGAVVDVSGTPATVTANTPTSVTFTTPALSAGNKDVTVTTAGGFATLSIEYYNLAGNQFDGWYRAPFGGSPWTPTASAGGSGTAGNLSEATNPPTVGTAVNGYAPADFNGTTNLLTGGVSSNFVTTSSGTLLAYVFIDTVSADTGQARTCRLVVGQINVNFFVMSVSTAGLRSSAFDTAHQECGPTPVATGGWHLLMVRWGGGTLEQSVDAGAVSSVPCTGPSTLTAMLRVGGSTTFFDGKGLEYVTSKIKISDANLAKTYACFRCRYGQ